MSLPYRSAAHAAEVLRPADPIFCLRPHLLRQTSKRFVEAFPGDVLYAVKCNDDDRFLRPLYEGGIRHFDTASIAEIRTIRRLFPDAVCHFMHPVKGPEAIAEAYHVHGVRAFVLDHADELAKILAATGNAPDLTLAVRLEMPRQQALLDLGGKFGATMDETVHLLRAAAAVAPRVGLTFHVGSQCVAPSAYRGAVALAGETIERAGVAIDMLDVGGGFPALYEGTEPDFEVFIDAIVEAVGALDLPDTCRLQCEPGRALVAEGASALLRVELRRDHALHLNDGVYGSLSEVKTLGPCFPIRVIRPGGQATAPVEGFGLFGPTCDSLDALPGPHLISGDVRTGDWLEIGHMGAYSTALCTGFNGFGSVEAVDVKDGTFHREAPILPFTKTAAFA
ncbi:MAG: type III PLP-dependent enzyme [Inquilinaceae bacterium]